MFGSGATVVTGLFAAEVAAAASITHETPREITWRNQRLSGKAGFVSWANGRERIPQVEGVAVSGPELLPGTDTALVTGEEKQEHGAAVVEFALALPIFIVLIFGVLEFGLIMYAKGVITQAGREGARYGVTYGTTAKTATEIQTYVQNYLTNMGFAGATVPLPIVASPTVTVTVNYTYNFLVLPNFITAMTGTLNLSAVTSMRME